MNHRFSIKITAFFLLSASLLFGIAFLFGAFDMPQRSKQTDIATSTESKLYTTVILDAGHGGEDGGASSAAGLVEKDINLDIAQKLYDMLRACGINVIMTRDDDRLLYDRNVDFKGRKKKLDLAARLAIADSTPDAIFVSLHMNSYPDPRYSGLQVWYSPNHPDSSVLAEQIKTMNRSTLQPNNKRETKAATSAINLLHNAKCPAILVECGFLSNPDEASKFETQEHRQKTAYMLFCAIIDFLQKSEDVSSERS